MRDVAKSREDGLGRSIPGDEERCGDDHLVFLRCNFLSSISVRPPRGIFHRAQDHVAVSVLECNLSVCKDPPSDPRKGQKMKAVASHVPSTKSIT